MSGMRIAWILWLAMAAAMPAQETVIPDRTLREWQQIVITEREEARIKSRSAGDYEAELTGLAEKGDKLAQVKLGVYHLKHEWRVRPFESWRLFREALGADHRLTQLARGYLYLELEAENDRDHSLITDVTNTLRRLKAPSLAALEEALAQEKDPRLRDRVLPILISIKQDR